MSMRDKRSTLQLTRLERLMDVVFALVIWRLFTLLPDLRGNGERWSSVAELIGREWTNFALVLLAVVIVIVYWLQSNTLLGNLNKTDRIHTAMSIFQMFFVLLFLYAISSGLRLGGGVDARLFESVMAMMVGVMAWLGWWYAMRKGALVDPELEPGEARLILQRNIAEPLTAAITLPFALVGSLAWELSWFLYPFIKFLFTFHKKT